MHELKARGSDGLERATLYAESCRNSPSFVLQDTQTRSFGSGRQHQLLLLLLLMMRRPPPLRVSLPGKHVPYSEYRCIYIYTHTAVYHRHTSVYLSISLTIYLSTDVSIFRSTCYRSICLSVCLDLSACFSNSLSLCLQYLVCYLHQ